MSGILNSTLKGSNSNLPDASGRTFPTSFAAQSGFSGASMNESGNMQGIHNIHGGYSMSNMPGPHASRNSANISGLQNGVQQPQGSVSNGRYTMNNVPNAISQPSLGSSHGHSGIPNTGGQDMLPNMGNTGRTANFVGGPVGGDYSIRGSSSSNVVNIPGLANSAIGRTANSVGGDYSIRGSSSTNVANIPGLANSAIGRTANSVTGNIGRTANSVGGLVGGDYSIRGSNSANVANIPGLASRLKMNDFSAPQMVAMHGNSYSGAGVPLAQNQYQAGNNQFSYMALLNDPNTPDNASLDLNDFPQLSGRPDSAGGSQGHLGLMQKHNISYNHQNQEFSMQNEDFPALPVYKDGINFGNGAQYSLNTPQNDQLRDMSNMMHSQPLSVGRSPGYNFGASYPSHHHQQHPASSINGGGVSYLPSGSQDLHYRGPEQYQHFQMPPSHFTNPYRDNEMIASVFQYPIVPDKYGLLGMLNTLKTNPSGSSLALGIDPTTLGMNLNSPELVHKKFASPWTDKHVREEEPEYTVPDCYYARQPPQLTKSHFAKFRIETLLYIFYSMPKDEAQLFAANEMYNRGWFYHRSLRLWFMRANSMEPVSKTNTHEKGSYLIFDFTIWQTIRKDNFMLQYDMVEKRPVLPQR